MSVKEKQSTRVLFRNIPDYYSKEKLGSLIESFLGLKLTDISILKTQSNKNRKLAFLGLRSVEDSLKVINHFNDTYIDTCKIKAEFAYPPGSTNIPRPWSRYSVGTTAFDLAQARKERNREKRKKKKELLVGGGVGVDTVNQDVQTNCYVNENNISIQLKNTQNHSDVISTNKKIKYINRSNSASGTILYVEPVKPTKSGVASYRQHVEFVDYIDSCNTSVALQELTNGNEPMCESTVADTNICGKVKTVPNQIDDDVTDSINWLVNTTLINGESPDDNTEEENQHKKAFDEPTNSLKNDVIDTGSLGDEGLDSYEANLRNNSNNHHSIEKQTKVDVKDQIPTSRLLFVNIPYSTCKEDLYKIISPYGDIIDIKMCLGQNELTHNGQAFIEFSFIEHAIKVQQKFHKNYIQGRIVDVKFADLPYNRSEVSRVKGKTNMSNSSYKRKLLEKLKENASNPTTYNLLYISPNASLESLSEVLGAEKKKILGTDDQPSNKSSMAANVALAETSIIHKTKVWLKEHNVNVEAFERQGQGLLSTYCSKTNNNVPRSKDCIIVKNLVQSITLTDIYNLFSPFGPIVRYDISPSKSVSIIQFLNESDAFKAFSNLSFYPLKNLPLMLEWAPMNVYLTPKPLSPTLHPDCEYSKSLNYNEDTIKTEPLKVEMDKISSKEQDENERTYIHIGNLNFITTENDVTKVFENCSGFIKATIIYKKKKIQSKTNEQAKLLSCGYGFLEINSSTEATKLIAQYQGIVIDGHSLKLEISKKKKRDNLDEGPTINISDDSKLNEIKSTTVDQFKEATNKIVIRNLAFQATKKDLRDLFSAFGKVIAVRIPKKPDNTSRGYGFVELLNPSEAVSAIESLQHTHLYGRKLILETEADSSSMK